MKHISLAEIDFSERVFEDVEFYLVYKESHFYENLVNYDNVGKIIKSVNSTLYGLKSSIPDFSNKIRAITQGLVAAQQNNIINEDRMQVIIDASQLNQNEIVNFVEQFIMHIDAIKHADNLLKESENMFDKHLDLSKEVKNSTHPEEIDASLKRIALLSNNLNTWCQFAYDALSTLKDCDDLSSEDKSLLKNAVRHACTDLKLDFNKHDVLCLPNFRLFLADSLAPNAKSICSKSSEVIEDCRNQTENIA